MRDEKHDISDLLLYGSIGLGIAAGGLMLAYLITRRRSDLLLPPLERAERMIENCESRIQAIQQTVESVHSQLHEDGRALRR